MDRSRPTAGVTATRPCSCPSGTFRMGSDAHYAEERPGSARSRRRVLDRRAPLTNAAVRRVRRRHRLRDGGRAAARPRRLPRRPAGEPRAGLDGVHAARRAGRPAAPQPVVDVDARRVLAPPGGPGVDARRPRRPPGRARRLRGRRRRTPPGRASACPPRRSGRSPPVADWTLRRTSGATSPRRRGSGWPTSGTATSPGDRTTGTAPPQPVGSFPPTATAFTTWPATCGSGPRDWYAETGPTSADGHGLLRAASPRPATPRTATTRAAAVPSPAPGHQGRLVPVRRQLLPALPACRPPTADGRHRHEPHRLPLRPPARWNACMTGQPV